MASAAAADRLVVRRIGRETPSVTVDRREALIWPHPIEWPPSALEECRDRSWRLGVRPDARIP